MAARQKRTPKEAAVDRVVGVAYDLFAEHGWEVPLSTIAKKARLTPPRLRALIGGKQALIDRVIEKLFAGRWQASWDALLADRTLPLEQRLTRFYVEYRGAMRAADSRLWTRAGLLGVHKSGKFTSVLAQRIMIPIVRELRHAATLPSPEIKPITAAERELASVLHGGIAFIHTRGHVFGMPVPGTLEERVAMNVRVFLAGAPAELRRLHA